MLDNVCLYKQSHEIILCDEMVLLSVCLVPKELFFLYYSEIWENQIPRNCFEKLSGGLCLGSEALSQIHGFQGRWNFTLVQIYHFLTVSHLLFAFAFCCLVELLFLRIKWVFL